MAPKNGRKQNKQKKDLYISTTDHSLSDTPEHNETTDTKINDVSKNNKFWFLLGEENMKLHNISHIAQAIIALFSVIGVGVAIYIAISQRDNLEKFAKIDDRAYVCYQETKYFKFNNGYLGQVSVAFRNTGKTPAYSLRSYSRFKFGDVDSSNWSEIFSHVNDEGGIVIGADQVREAIISSDTAINNIDIANFIQSGKDQLKPKWHIYGVWWYTDIFGINHWTRYCRNIRWIDTTFPAFKKFNDTEEGIRGKY